jgi:hypothetical protein
VYPARRFLSRLHIAAFLAQRLGIRLGIRSAFTERDHMIANRGNGDASRVLTLHAQGLAIEELLA